MAFRNTNSAENWEKLYEAFSQVNFTSFDFDTIKASLVDYLRIYYPEVFNDFIESSELVALLEAFAYIAEQLAYRVDMVSHENFITVAQRKQSILRLAKLISYKATRNIPTRGLVKFNSVSTTETVIDSRGINLSGLTINWNDPNNPNWKEQFVLVMNRVLTSRFGQPQKSFQVGDVVMDLYALGASTGSFNNGVYPFTASTGLDSFPMEVVPSDLDENGPFEREPDANSALGILYANDGIGDGSDYTGFLAFVKQGTLARIDYNILEALPNRKLEFLPENVNQTDVWVQKVDGLGNITERWKQVETVNEQNLIFNSDRSTRRKYEVDTLENDQIAVVFGDGDFTEVPVGLFRFWMRQSANRAVVIPKNKVVNEPLSFTYVSQAGSTETCTMAFSLTTTLQNGSGSETIEHIRQSAPATYYAQNRMVNGQDYNTYMLKDPSILRLKTVNRTFAGQPKYIDWNDASGSYENVKIFGDDLKVRYELQLNSQTTSVSGQALIDSVIEPLLNNSGVITALVHISATDPATRGVVSSPRRSFIEDNRANIYYSAGGAPVSLINGSAADGSLKEKTAMQGLIDRHWYGEPLEFVEAPNGQIWARIPDPDLFPKDDSRIYSAAVPRTIDGVNRFPPGDIGSGLQPIAEQDYFALRYNRTLRGIGDGTIQVDSQFAVSGVRNAYKIPGEVWTIEVAADGETLNVRSSIRGTFPSGTVGEVYDFAPPGQSESVPFFIVIQGQNISFEPGDAFVLDTSEDLTITMRDSTTHGAAYSSTGVINLNGWWEILGTADLGPEFAAGPDSSAPFFHDQAFTMDPQAGKKNSWLIFVRKIRQQPTNSIIGYEVYYRDLKIVVESPTTKFWFNEAVQIIDSETQKRVFDSIKILRSNLDSTGNKLPSTQIYDVVGPVKDGLGEINFNKLQIVPSDLLQEDDSGNLEPDRLLQFVNFAGDEVTSFEYFLLTNPGAILTDSTGRLAAVAAFTGAAGVEVQTPGSGYTPTGGVLTVQVSVDSAGLGIQNGTYSDVPVVDTTLAGSGALAEIVVFDNNISSITITTPGAGYTTMSELELSGSGFSTTNVTITGFAVGGSYVFSGANPSDPTRPYQFQVSVRNGSVVGASVVSSGTSFKPGDVVYVPQDPAFPGSPITSQDPNVAVLRITSILADASSFVEPSDTYGRRQVAANQLDPAAKGLDFMWQHYAPFTNIIDPSVTNIHDAYVLTQGYYDQLIDFVRGISVSAPIPPTPLELRNSYSYLLQNKMLSDTVVMHPGRIRLLFGSLAEPQLRAKFKVVKAQGSTLTNERIKEELLNVINVFFDISRWDFGDTFYATELIAMMHQRLPVDIASAVLVPLYSTNSFGDLFTVECGFDEILQSAAQLSDIEIVEALTPTTIRQVR